MNRSDILHRMVGGAALSAAVTIILTKRNVWMNDAPWPMTGREAVLAMLTLTLAAAGVLFLIGPARRSDGAKRPRKSLSKPRCERMNSER